MRRAGSCERRRRRQVREPFKRSSGRQRRACETLRAETRTACAGRTSAGVRALALLRGAGQRRWERAPFKGPTSEVGRAARPNEARRARRAPSTALGGSRKALSRCSNALMGSGGREIRQVGRAGASLPRAVHRRFPRRAAVARGALRGAAAPSVPCAQQPVPASVFVAMSTQARVAHCSLPATRTPGSAPPALRPLDAPVACVVAVQCRS